MSKLYYTSLEVHYNSSPEESDWNVIIKECSSLAANWEHLSGYLGLSIGLIDTIKGNYPNDKSGCWNEALKEWIKQNYKTEKFGLPSWRTLLEAVARDNRLLFKKLAKTYQTPGKQNMMMLCHCQI